LHILEYFDGQFLDTLHFSSGSLQFFTSPIYPRTTNTEIIFTSHRRPRTISTPCGTVPCLHQPVTRISSFHGNVVALLPPLATRSFTVSEDLLLNTPREPHELKYIYQAFARRFVRFLCRRILLNSFLRAHDVTFQPEHIVHCRWVLKQRWFTSWDFVFDVYMCIRVYC
jgi:hypothetical protein